MQDESNETEELSSQNQSTQIEQEDLIEDQVDTDLPDWYPLDSMSRELYDFLEKSGLLSLPIIPATTLPLVLRRKNVVAADCKNENAYEILSIATQAVCEQNAEATQTGPIVLVIGNETENTAKLDEKLRKIPIFSQPDTEDFLKVDTSANVLKAVDSNSVSLADVKLVALLDDSNDWSTQDLDTIFSSLQKRAQKLLICIQLGPQQRSTAFRYIDNPDFVTEAPEKIDLNTLDQHMVLADGREKIRALLGFLRDHKFQKAIVYTNSAASSEWLANKLSINGQKTECIPEPLDLSDRIRFTERFSESDERKILVTTDSACHGFFMNGVTHIYNFDIPSFPLHYVSRIRRATRSPEQQAKIFTLVCENHGANLDGLKKLLGGAIPAVELFDESYLAIEEVKPPRPEGRPTSRVTLPPHKKKSPYRGHVEQEETRRENVSNRKPRPSVETTPEKKGFLYLLKRLFRLFFGGGAKESKQIEDGSKNVGRRGQGHGQRSNKYNESRGPKPRSNDRRPNRGGHKSRRSDGNRRPRNKSPNDKRNRNYKPRDNSPRP